MYRRVLLAGICLAALVGAASAETVLNRGNDTDPATLDQHHTSTVSENRVLRDLYEGLVAQNERAKPFPARPRHGIFPKTASPIHSTCAKARNGRMAIR